MLILIQNLNNETETLLFPCSLDEASLSAVLTASSGALPSCFLPEKCSFYFYN